MKSRLCVGRQGLRLEAEGGKVTTLKVVGYDKGGLTSDIKDRPAIRYDLSATKDQGPKNAAQQQPQPEGAAGTPPAGTTEAPK